MNTNQSWIKYLAIAFGLVLALGIISSIVNGGVAIMRGFGLIEDRKQVIQQGEDNFQQDFNGDLEAVFINFNAGSITLQSGTALRVEGTDIPAGLSASYNSQLVIEDSGTSNFLPNLIGRKICPI